MQLLKIRLQNNTFRIRSIDPRYYQLTVQISLLLWGILALGFNVKPVDIFTTLFTAIAVQWVCTRWVQIPLNILSTLNTSLSIILLLHAAHWLWFMLAAMIAISSKFLIRFDGRHLFNPSNIGIVVAILVTESAWAAPGQWGQTMWWALMLAGTGLIVLLGFSRVLTTWVFLVTYAGLILLRSFWLGDVLLIPYHQLQNGSLLIFAFFMLSDPMTIPESAKGRVIYGVWVAVLAWILQFWFYIPNAFLYALVASSLLVVGINRLSQGRTFVWKTGQ
jgi:Na+-transporting NADH:ubiquinone oxidoreductase subunit NqrB